MNSIFTLFGIFQYECQNKVNVDIRYIYLHGLIIRRNIIHLPKEKEETRTKRLKITWMTELLRFLFIRQVFSSLTHK